MARSDRVPGQGEEQSCGLQMDIPPPPELTISVVIPVYNGGANFRRCLSSVAEAVPPPTEVIVVSDGDTDGSWRLAEASGAQVLREPASRGPARARNLGGLAARGEILFFVDADVTIPRDAVGRVAAAFRGEPGLAAVFGTYDDEPAATNFLSQYKNLLHHYVHQTGREEASTFWGACGAIRREVFLALGGFDEGYRWPSIEDVELGYRLKQAGHRIRLCKALQVKHLKRWGVASLLKSDFLHRAIPWTELILRDHGFIDDLNLRHSSRVSVLLTCGLLGALVGARWWRGSLAVAAAISLALLALNADLYLFFRRKRGLQFALQAIAWHWLYYLYSSIAFAIGAVRHLFHRRRSRGVGLAKAPRQWSDTESGPELR